MRLKSRRNSKHHDDGRVMKNWLKNLPLRHKLTFMALAVEALMLLLLIANGMRINTAELHEQTRLRAQNVAQALAAALGSPLSQRDDAGARDILDALQSEQQFVMLAVRDRSGHLVHQIGAPDSASDIQLTRPVLLAGQRYGELSLTLSGALIQEARTRYLQQSLMIAAVALVLTSILLYWVVGWVVRRFEALSRASKSMAQGDLYVTLPEDGQDEVGLLVGTFNQMAQSVRYSVERARENEARFHAIADYTYDIELWLSPEGKLLWVNPSVQRILGYTVGECMGNMDFPVDVVYPADRSAVERQLRQALRGTSGQGYSFRVCRKDGGHFWATANWQPIHDISGAYQGIRASIHDINDLKATEASLREAITELRVAENLQTHYLKESEQERARLVSLLSAMNLGILFVAADTTVIYHNATFNRMWLIDERTELIGMPVQDVLAKSTSTLARPDHFSKHLLSVLEAREVSDSFEIQMTDGRVITELDYPVRDTDGCFIGHLWVYEDITRERQTAEQLVYLAERDALTGLYNRHRFQHELTRTMLECERQKSQCAVMFFDLDEFKSINDTYGHRAGDALLIRIAGEISALIRKNEVLARLGGDEFAILLPNTHDDEAEQLAERVVRAVAQVPFRFEGQNLRVTASLGIAYFPKQASDADELVARADIAMYQAKQAGKNAWRVYRADLVVSQEIQARLSWSERIRNAFDQGLFQLHFQGIYWAHQVELSHVEALIRMRDEFDLDKLIMPDHFIPVAEKSGLIVEIDRWVIREALQILALNHSAPAIAVNLSGRSVSEPTLPQYIAEELRLSGVNPKRLIVEITETAAVADLHDAQRLIEALRQLGCGVCLDDFGVGFASFAYLKHLKVDTIKIDGLFIRDLHVDSDNQVFVRAMVDIARGLGKTVVAEYVEDARTLTILRGFGVDMVQGYHMDRPTADHPALTMQGPDQESTR
jgi:diguanylate cyclase (GGDEF)-like protein/PAS domain S-box-containing protein